MKLELLPPVFTVCQTPGEKQIDFSIPFTFFARTDEEISLVCPVDFCPADALNREDGWRCLRILGPLDFSLVGILSQIAQTLANEKIPIFAVSTFNTDYVLFRTEYTEKALRALSAAGHKVSVHSS